MTAEPVSFKILISCIIKCPFMIISTGLTWCVNVLEKKRERNRQTETERKKKRTEAGKRKK